MKRIGLLVAVAALTFTFATLPAQAGQQVNLVASNWKFTPAEITVPAGEPTSLRLTSSEGVHGIASSDLGIPDTTILPNKFVTVTFTPKKAGTYQVHCSIVCGAGHPNMILTVKVTQ